ncbi:MAG TPA: ThuA domain-containing protein [Thermoguttaceae bacterium]|nr:ThuA domain-containing protein [Thermoguttaceae bacterium]
MKIHLLLAVCCSAVLPGVSLAVSPEEAARIEAAVPDRTTVEPKKPRKLLVFSVVGGNHTATPYGAMMLDLMAKKTGAFEVVHSTDPASLKAENLAPFDAVCFNNANRLRCFDDPVLCRGLLDFVRSGKGLVGIHAASTNFAARWGSEWPEGAELLGGIFEGHPWHEKVTVKVADPDHPLNAAFAGQGFEITDEIYQFTGPHSREKLRILLRLDETRTNMNKPNKMDRPDDDFAVSWVQRYGEGRVFYCSLGHDHPVFWNEKVVRHYLDGIQFALGDLPADTTPSEQVGE